MMLRLFSCIPISSPRRVAAAILAWLALAGGLRAEEDVYPMAARMATAHRAALEDLAVWCDGKGLTEEAARTRGWRTPHAPDKIYVAVFPQRAGGLDPPEGAAGDVLAWHRRFARLRQEQSKALHALARRAARQGALSLAVELLVAAIHEDPDNEAVRHLLGYQKHEGGWHTAYEVRKLRSGQVWHERFGWIRRADAPRWESGERPYQNRWISAEEDARLHGDIQSGWDVQTEHYVIRTNHSIEAAVALGGKLEEFYNVWGRLFVHYYTSEAQLAASIEGRFRGSRPDPPKHMVVLFRDRAAYNEALKPIVPTIEMSVGLYSHQTHRAYFFVGEEEDQRTFYHEATHQLFQESRPVATSAGLRANFWIIEGIALYMESLRREGDYYVLGGADDVRMEDARFRLLEDGFYVPLAELVTYGLAQMQADPRIGTLYSQMSGLAHFFIHSHEGRYRDALVRYLAAVYQGSQNPALLERLTGVPYAELDRQYREFIAHRPAAHDAPNQR